MLEGYTRRYGSTPYVEIRTHTHHSKINMLGVLSELLSVCTSNRKQLFANVFQNSFSSFIVFLDKERGFSMKKQFKLHCSEF